MSYGIGMTIPQDGQLRARPPAHALDMDNRPLCGYQPHPRESLQALRAQATWDRLSYAQLVARCCHQCVLQALCQDGVGPQSSP